MATKDDSRVGDMDTKWIHVRAINAARPGPDYCGGALTREDALAKAQTSYLYGREGWRFELVHVPERYGDPIRYERVN